MFNQYSIYSSVLNDTLKQEDDRIINTIKRINASTEYYDVVDMVKDVFGDFENDVRSFSFKNDLKVFIRKEENCIGVLSLQNDKCLCQKRWRFIPHKN